jgi:hypothetical protein
MNASVKRAASLAMLAMACCCLFSSQAFAQAGVGTTECRQVQLDAQAAVAAGEPYRNHGAMVSVAAAVVDAAVTAGTIDAECASCIMHQFAKKVAIADQEACGPDSPNPECAAAQCGTFVSCSQPCDPSGCVALAEGGGLCVTNISCGGLVPCPGGSGDCPSGSLCAVNTCCSGPVCVPPEAFCSTNGGANSTAAIIPAGTPSILGSGN